MNLGKTNSGHYFFIGEVEDKVLIESRIDRDLFLDINGIEQVI
jgi:hypothetical protein